MKALRVVKGISIVLLAVFIMNSCDRDELAEPVPVYLEINMASYQADAKQSPGKKFTVDKGKIRFSGLEFDGKKENSDDYYFSKSFSPLLVGDLGNNTLNRNVSFDIPQGTYNPINLSLFLSNSDTIPAFCLQGTYQSNQHGEVEVHFRFFRQEEMFLFKAENKAGNKKIVLQKGNNEKMQVDLRLQSLFSLFNPNQLESAEYIIEGGKTKIIISENHNQNIYYSLVNRIERTIHVVVK